MSGSAPSAHALRVSDLPQNAETAFEIVPDAATLAELAQTLGLDGLRKLRLSGTVSGQGKADWVLQARLGATVVQPCGVTLAPVTTRIDTEVRRLYLRDYEEPEAPEVEMPEDETIEPLARWIDPEAVMIEALSLEIPEFPRASDAAMGEVVATEPGKQALRDADLKPFAGLAALKTQMGDKEG
ncbi:MAG: DUF177 domain-containing protein [Pseudomonadota bacterium]